MAALLQAVTAWLSKQYGIFGRGPDQMALPAQDGPQLDPVLLRIAAVRKPPRTLELDMEPLIQLELPAGANRFCGALFQGEAGIWRMGSLSPKRGEAVAELRVEPPARSRGMFIRE